MSLNRSFETWYRDTYARMSTAMLAVCGDRDVASDATDEAFSRAWHHWETVGGMTSPEGWTYRVALNLVRSRLRRRRVEQRLLPRLVNRSNATAPAGEIWELVRELAPRQRIAVALRYVADLSESEIGEAMGVTRGTVSSTLFAARQALGAALAVPDAVEERS
jgi:RNA polymerase sigma factor (sigma-70 family)